MESEMRLVHLSPVSTECVPIRLTRSAQVRGVEIAFPVEHLAEPECYHRTGLASDTETHPAGEVLTEVEYGFPRRCSADIYRTQLPHSAHRRRHRCHERRRRRIEQRNHCPLAIVVPGACPSAERPPRIVRFPAIDIRREDRTHRGLPLGIRDDALGASALIADLELGAQGKPPAIEIALAEEPEMAPIPAIAEHPADDVGAWPE